MQTSARNPPPEGISVSDYEAIEDAVMETARGRWFLKEYARRMRASETASLHAALERIERIVTLTHAPRADADAQLKMRERLEGVCERLLDISWFMRERGFSGSICASIDEEARQLGALIKAFEITAASGVDEDGSGPGAGGQDAGGQDAPGEAQSDSCTEAPQALCAPVGAGLAEAPAVGLKDSVAPDAEPAASAPMRAAAEEPFTKPAPAFVMQPAAFVHIDAMSTRERLALCA